MANPWFRMYSEFAHDPKVQSMSEAMQRRLALIFCMECDGVTETLHETEIAFYLHISEMDLAETKELFLRKGFIDERWKVLNWNKRQYISDSSTERVRKHRERSREDHETGVKREGNVSETAPDTESDTENISEAKASSPRRTADGGQVSPEELIYHEYPRKEGHRAAIKEIERAVDRVRKGESMPAMEIREARIFLFKRVQAYARSPAGQRADKSLIPHPATWFRQSRYLDDERNWQLIGKEIQGNGNTRNSNYRTKTGGNIDAAKQAIASILGDEADIFGPMPAGSGGPGDSGVVLEGIVEVRPAGYLESSGLSGSHQAPRR